MKGLDHEECWCMFLNSANKVIRRLRMTIGGLTSTVFDQKDIMRIALELNASGVILAHNHPSGDPSPSMADVKMTEALNKAGKVLEIAVIDHIILSDSCYYSFNDESKNSYDPELLKQLHA